MKKIFSFLCISGISLASVDKLHSYYDVPFCSEKHLSDILKHINKKYFHSIIKVSQNLKKIYDEELCIRGLDVLFNADYYYEKTKLKLRTYGEEKIIFRALDFEELKNNMKKFFMFSSKFISRNEKRIKHTIEKFFIQQRLSEVTYLLKVLSSHIDFVLDFFFSRDFFLQRSNICKIHEINDNFNYFEDDFAIELALMSRNYEKESDDDTDSEKNDENNNDDNNEINKRNENKKNNKYLLSFVVDGVNKINESEIFNEINKNKKRNEKYAMTITDPYSNFFLKSRNLFHSFRHDIPLNSYFESGFVFIGGYDFFSEEFDIEGGILNPETAYNFQINHCLFPGNEFNDYVDTFDPKDEDICLIKKQIKNIEDIIKDGCAIVKYLKYEQDIYSKAAKKRFNKILKIFSFGRCSLFCEHEFRRLENLKSTQIEQRRFLKLNFIKGATEELNFLEARKNLLLLKMNLLILRKENEGEDIITKEPKDQETEKDKLFDFIQQDVHSFFEESKEFSDILQEKIRMIDQDVKNIDYSVSTSSLEHFIKISIDSNGYKRVLLSDKGRNYFKFFEKIQQDVQKELRTKIDTQ